MSKPTNKNTEATPATATEEGAPIDMVTIGDALLRQAFMRLMNLTMQLPGDVLTESHKTAAKAFQETMDETVDENGKELPPFPEHRKTFLNQFLVYLEEEAKFAQLQEVTTTTPN